MIPAQPGEINPLITQLEADRQSRVIVYCTSSKQPVNQFGTVIALDVLPKFKKILDAFPKGGKITLVLDTAGGNLFAPWPLVNLIREYCETFEVVVLDKALSAGTMISLGADKIVMMPHSQLSPIDPAANIVDGEKKQTKHFEIEDIMGFTKFAKEKIGIKNDAGLVEVLKELTKEITPTMLGSVNRTHSLVRKLANNLLNLHSVKLKEKDRKRVVDNLTQELFSHSHLINRKEAKEDVGLSAIIEYSSTGTGKIAEQINDYIVNLTEVDKLFNPPQILGDAASKNHSLVRAVILSSGKKYYFVTDYHLAKIPDPSGNNQFVVNPQKEGWEER